MSLLSLTKKLQWESVPELVQEKYAELQPQIQAIWQADLTPAERCEQLAYLTGFKSASEGWSGLIPMSPNPLVNSVVGGLAGAGLGYGLGWAGEQFMPNWPNKHRTRLTGALIGALAGLSPGAMQMQGNYMLGKPLLSPVPRGFDPADAAAANPPAPPSAVAEYDAPLLKQSLFQGTGIMDNTFDADKFNKLVWQDPRVSDRLSTPMQAAASGLVSGAASLRGSPTKLVTPLDIGRVAAGMGSDYVSGMLVGKALGALMGLPESTQDRLKSTGMWAGVIANVVPIAFGR